MTRGAPPERRAVVLVEDDDAVRDAVARGLGLHGFDVIAVADGAQGLAEIARSRPDVVVVDVGLPGLSGIEVCNRLRSSGLETPVLVLSARDQVGDRIAGLEAGADDYVVKPFDLDELVLRLHALLRRAARSAPTGVHVVGPLRIDEQRRLVTVDGSPLELSRREFDLAAVLAANRGIVLSRVRLLELVWGYDFEVESNVVDVFVGYLRRKLASAGAPPLIHTIRGIGFVMRVDS